MSHAQVVIGANFGDEGKGLLTDYLARPDSVVVRFNGGGQAGHTVVTPAGQRHVFHHFGAGAFQGSATHLSRYFISNPLLLLRERTDLAALGVQPVFSADPNGAVTTPFDMMLNQMAEQARGDARHGSCGLGINETIKREEAGLTVSVAMLNQPAMLRHKLQMVRDHWLPLRAASLDLTITPDWQVRIRNEAIIDAFVDAAWGFGATLIADADRLYRSPPIVFEGAQGLLLDQDHRFFPHVTHAYTGLRNVIALAEAAEITDLDVTYVTRCYTTRHGAGPLPQEVPGLTYRDDTNQPNDWQGTLRFGRLDLPLLRHTIQHDLRHASNRPIRIHPGIALTHLDQIDYAIPVITGQGQQVLTVAELQTAITAQCGLPVRYASTGPTRDDVRKPDL